MTEAILTAIKTAYDNSPLPAFLEGLFHAEAPQTTTGDYMTYFIVTSPREYTMSSRSSRPVVQFSIWTDDSSPLDAIRTMELWCVWLDGELGAGECELDLEPAGGNQIRLDREIDPQTLRDPDGGWQVFVTYRAWIMEA